MRRLIVMTVAAAAFGAFVLTRQGYGPDAAATGWASLLAFAGLAVSIAALAVSLTALSRANAAGRDMTRLVLSFERRIDELAARHQKETSGIADLNAMVEREFRSLIARMDENQASEPAESDAAGKAAPSRRSNVIPHPASLSRQPTQRKLDGSLEELLATAVRSRSLEISLQPVISVGSGMASAFDVFAHIEQAGRPIDVARLASPASDMGVAEFESALLHAAAETSRRKLGLSSERTPLHVPVSRALLDDAATMTAALDLFRTHPGLGRSLLLTFPADTFSNPPLRSRLLQLNEAGARFAVEGWDEAFGAQAAANELGVVNARLSCARLLGREKLPRGAVGAETLLETARDANIAMIATGVSTDEDAVSLIDLGIDLLVGDRFSAPRRLKGVEGTQPSRPASGQTGG